MVTGESLPVDKAPGDARDPAPRSTTGAFKFQATRWKRTPRWPRLSSWCRTPWQQGAHRPSGGCGFGILRTHGDDHCHPDLPGLVQLWAVAGAGYAVVTAVTVLIIACPCAVGMAMPLSLVAGVGKGGTWRAHSQRRSAADGISTQGHCAGQNRHHHQGQAGTDRYRAAPGIDAANAVASCRQRRSPQRTIRCPRLSGDGARSSRNWSNQ